MLLVKPRIRGAYFVSRFFFRKTEIMSTKPTDAFIPIPIPKYTASLSVMIPTTPLAIIPIVTIGKNRPIGCPCRYLWNVIFSDQTVATTIAHSKLNKRLTTIKANKGNKASHIFISPVGVIGLFGNSDEDPCSLSSATFPVWPA